MKIISINCNSSKIPPSTSMHFSTLLAILRVALLRSTWRSSFVRAALSITASSYNCSHMLFRVECLSSVSAMRAHRICTSQIQKSNSCISTLIENWTHVYMNLFTRNSPHYHLLKYLLFLLKHPV